MTRRTACALTCVSLAIAFSSVVRVAAQEQLIALGADWLIDGTGRPPVADALVIVRGNRIEAVGTRATVRVPAGAKILDLHGQTLLPGLIDTHSHLVNRSMFPSPFGGPGQRRAPPAEHMVKMVRHARVQLLCGITTLRQCGEPGLADLVLKQAIELGIQVGPRIIGGGEHIGPEIESAEALRKKVREYFQAGAEWIKMTHTDLTPTTAQIPPELLKAGIDEAHRLGLKATVHAVGRWGSALRTSIEAGADNIEHARPLTEEIVQLMLKHGTSASLTPLAYVGWYQPPDAFETMDLGVRSAAEWMEYLEREVAEYRRTHPEVETTNRPFESPITNLEPWRVTRDMYQALETVRRQYRRAHELGLPFSLGLDARYRRTGVADAVPRRGGDSTHRRHPGCDECGGQAHRLRRPGWDHREGQARRRHRRSRQPDRRHARHASNPAGHEGRGPLRHAVLAMSRRARPPSRRALRRRPVGPDRIDTFRAGHYHPHCLTFNNRLARSTRLFRRLSCSLTRADVWL